MDLDVELQQVQLHLSQAVRTRSTRARITFSRGEGGEVVGSFVSMGWSWEVFAARTTLPLFMEQHGSVKGSSRSGFGEKHIWELILVITSLKSRYRTIIGCDMMYSVSSDSLVDFSKMLELHRLASPHPFKLRPGKLRKSLCRMWLKPLTQTHTGWDDTDS